MHCSHCQNILSDTAKFCGECGHVVEAATATPPPAPLLTCPQCAAVCKPQAQFCGKCGHHFASAAPPDVPQEAPDLPAPAGVARSGIKPGLLWGAGAGVVLLLVLFTGWLMSQGASPVRPVESRGVVPAPQSEPAALEEPPAPPPVPEKAPAQEPEEFFITEDAPPEPRSARTPQPAPEPDSAPVLLPAPTSSQL